jgi:hypothetical protein
MKFPITTIKHLNYLPSVSDRQLNDDWRDCWEDESVTVPPHDLGSGNTTDRHGSFELVTTVSEQSEDSYATALEDTQPARLTSEEAAAYLKSVLKVGTNPTIGNFNNILTGDAREDSTLVTHGSPWIPVTRHYSMHTKAEHGPTPSKEGEQAETGVLSQDSTTSGSGRALDRPRHRPWTEASSTTKETLRTTGRNNARTITLGYREEGMPHHLIKKLDQLDTKEFDTALNYWMNHFNFVGYPTTSIDHPQRLPAYDEGLYRIPRTNLLDAASRTKVAASTILPNVTKSSL